MRLAAVIVETDEQAMYSACATHKEVMEEWAWAEAMDHDVAMTEGVTFGDCHVEDGKEHQEYTYLEDRVLERSIRS